MVSTEEKTTRNPALLDFVYRLIENNTNSGGKDPLIAI